jgi:uncharacterized membrane protein
MTNAIFVLTVAAAVGSGLTAGMFFAFSSFVMAALGRIDPRSGVAAMQSINVVVINPAFMLVFMGPGLLSLALAAAVFAGWTGGEGRLLLAGAALYVVGCIGVTMALNVPLNNALAAVPADSPEAAALWAGYLKDWTLWNHVRTLAALAASVLFVAGLVRRANTFSICS